MRKYNVITGIITFLLIALSVLIIVVFNLPKEGEPEFDYLKNYKDNEYMPIYISEEKMARLYYSDYIYYINNDMNKAYEMLNADYRRKKFQSLDDFKNYVDSYKEASLESYGVGYTKDKTVFYIKLSGNLNLIFATTGVMKYEMYFDENTVEIE